MRVRRWSSNDLFVARPVGCQRFTDPKEPTQFGSASGSEIQNLPFSHSGIISLYRSEPREPTLFGFVSRSEIKNICIGRNLADDQRTTAFCAITSQL